MQAYIVNYEDEKKDNTDDVVYFFKELLIDARQNLFPDLNTTNKLILTQLDHFQIIESANTVNTLANNAFKHQTILANTTILLVNLIPYSFTISTYIQYNNFKLKGLLIDSSTTNWFTSGLG